MSNKYRIEIKGEIPSDHDGFLRLQCPKCEGQFKAFAGKHDSHFVTRYCPLCGEPDSADTEDWVTDEQREFLTNAALSNGLDRVMDQLFSDVSNKSFQVKRTGSNAPKAPSPIAEPNDMDIIVPPCHEDTPIKVPDATAGPFYCLFCGAEFTV